MGKRSDFVRNKHDVYDTPPEAVLPLLPHLRPDAEFIEPCAGSGQLIKALKSHGFRCVEAFDIEPRGEDIFRADARTFNLENHMAKMGVIRPPDYFISNFPWTRDILHAIIFNLFWQLPTWCLLDADWMHNRSAAPFIPLCRKIVSVGRVKWIPDSPHTGKENAAWFLFAAPERGPEFIGRR